MWQSDLASQADAGLCLVSPNLGRWGRSHSELLWAADSLCWQQGLVCHRGSSWGERAGSLRPVPAAGVWGGDLVNYCKSWSWNQNTWALCPALGSDPLPGVVL